MALIDGQKDNRPVKGGLLSDAAPSAYIALSIIIIARSCHRTIGFKSERMGTSRRNCPNVAPTAYIALVMLIQTNGNHRAIRFKTHGMITPPQRLQYRANRLHCIGHAYSNPQP